MASMHRLTHAPQRACSLSPLHGRGTKKLATDSKTPQGPLEEPADGATGRASASLWEGGACMWWDNTEMNKHTINGCQRYSEHSSQHHTLFVHPRLSLLCISIVLFYGLILIAVLF